MNKKYYLALAATAALFAGCSSDDNFADESRMATINDGDKAAIELLIGNPAGTRGTGTVGGMAENDPYNKWGGQKFNVYMLNKGTLDIAKDAENHDIYNNTVFTAPNELAGVSSETPAMEVTNTSDGGLVVETKVSYFPQEGNFDFWAYRTDGAETGVPAVSGTSLDVNFDIDGSQDIMTAKAVPNVPENNINPDTGIGDGTYGQEKVPEGRIFSAYSVRREVKPMLKFNHELTRLVFKVKGSKELSNKAANAEASVADTTNTNDLAVRVTAIKVKSLATGKLHIAYTANPTSTIEWTDGSEAVLSLQQRGVNYTPAELAWRQANIPYGTITVGTNNAFVFNAETTVYTSKAVDAKKGLPLPANAKTAAQAATDGDLANCWLCYIEDQPQAGAISVNADLEALDPVAPIWNNTGDKAFKTQVGEALLVAPQLNYELTVETVQKLPATKRTVYYNVEQVFGGSPATYGSEDASATYADEDAYDALDADKKAGKGDAAALAAAEIAANKDKYFYNTDDSKVYKIIEVTPATDPDATLYFKTAADAADALEAYNAWVTAGKATSGAVYNAWVTAQATGSETSGAVEEVLTYTYKNDTKTIQLNGPSTTVGAQTTYKPYKANKSYTITLTLAGMEPTTGGNDNIGIGGYDVDEEGSEFDIDMDEEPSLP
jgi:hypothetical protein